MTQNDAYPYLTHAGARVHYPIWPNASFASCAAWSLLRVHSPSPPRTRADDPFVLLFVASDRCRRALLMSCDLAEAVAALDLKESA
jgi:hypothetical protein